MYETKAEQQDLKRGAAAATIHSTLDDVSGNPEKNIKITDLFGNEATCAKEDADNALCLLFAALRLSERIADDPVFRYAVLCIARAGPGYVPPKRRYIGGAGLKKVRRKIEVAFAPVAASWKRDGVTVSSDMMTDRCGRPQANVLLVNDSGAVFELANVVAVCTDGGSNYASVAKKITSTWPHIEHVPCATHVLDLMMEDIGKMGWAKGLGEKGGEMITFVRNHHCTRAYMKKVGGKQVLKPAGTRFGTQYIAMARLCEVRSGLAAMVLSDEWKVWAAADKDRKTAAEKFRAAVMDEEWWGVAEFLYLSHGGAIQGHAGHGLFRERHDGTVVPGNIPDAPIPPGYNMDEEEDDMLGEEGEDAVLADEYGEGVVAEKPRKEIGCGEAN
ncbi:unnamed protein product [Closterium sp. NIES-64]|nr:unnamed protein product [Closterium sp. NIES-64]